MKKLYSWIAEKLQFVSPEFYRERYFKKMKNLSRNNVLELNLEPELVWIHEILNKNSVVLEIGANVGSYLFQYEKKLKPENIIAFEPNKKLHHRLLRIFPHMRIFCLALSDENTFASFKIPVINGKKVTSRGTLQTEFLEKDEQKTILQKVKVIRLDDWAELEHISRIDLIKIDVEGNEMHTLKGAQETITKYRPVLMVEMEQRHHKVPLWKLITEISDWGFSPKYLDRNDFQLKDLSEKLISVQDEEQVKNKTEYINNIIFIPK